MIVQFRNEKVSNHGSIPITIDCNVVAFIVFEEGFHQPIKRTKQSVFLDVVSSDEVEKDVLISLAAVLPQHPAVPNQMDAGPEKPNGRGSLVQIKNPASFSTPTPGRIVDTHPGADGICRVVTIQTSSGVMTRPVSQVAVLPLPLSIASSRPPPKDVKNSHSIRIRV
ncbi:hypothetical protein TNCV_2206321 [Trichonephila clavipes]|uniref:DUF5641 domain-containing protein n=1 Tax=Trichonephila clavipes TaxID=2585209 RepID=A0A8X6S2E0_TRICX|nr:hypothetical protein TNCV_2206321 [Trichonephila clavipes]